MKLSHRPKELIAVSPEATVPVLVEPDGTVIEESIDIMRRALERNDPEGWLEREDRALIEANDGLFKHTLIAINIQIAIFPTRPSIALPDSRCLGAGNPADYA